MPLNVRDSPSGQFASAHLCCKCIVVSTHKGSNLCNDEQPAPPGGGGGGGAARRCRLHDGYAEVCDSNYCPHHDNARAMKEDDMDVDGTPGTVQQAPSMQTTTSFAKACVSKKDMLMAQRHVVPSAAAAPTITDNSLTTNALQHNVHSTPTKGMFIS